MADIVSVFMITIVLAIYLILKLIYPKDKFIAGILIMIIGIVLMANTGIDTRDEIMVFDTSDGSIINEFQVDTNSSFLYGETATFAPGLMITVVGLIIIIRLILDMLDQKRIKSKKRYLG